MKRSARVALNFLLPPLLGAGCFVTGLCAIAVGEFYQARPASSARNAFSDIIEVGPMIAFYAYSIAGLPSLLHAVLMEMVYWKFPANRWTAVGASTLSGILAGLVITGFIVNGRIRKIPDNLVFIVVGCIVGFSLGLIIKWLSRVKIAHRTPALRGCE